MLNPFAMLDKTAFRRTPSRVSVEIAIPGDHRGQGNHDSILTRARGTNVMIILPTTKIIKVARQSRPVATPLNMIDMTFPAGSF